MRSMESVHGESLNATSQEILRYDATEVWCQEVVSSGSDFLFDTSLFRDRLPTASNELEFPVEALYSFFRNIHLVHVKRTTHRVRSSIQEHLNAYSKGKTILELAKAANFPPYIFARHIVEHAAIGHQKNKKAITEAMRDPERRLGNASVIAPDFLDAEKFRKEQTNKMHAPPRLTRLAQEVMEAIRNDPMYGPRHDRERSVIGVEYEILLEQTLRRMDIPFETETELRERGTARTPDILLSCPVGIQVPKRSGEGLEWKVVSWIDSKALFGDVNTHQTSVLPQAETYVHRFGPGLVLYWFGHAPLARLDDGHGDVAIVGWRVPEVMLLPTGEFASEEIAFRKKAS